jgi:MYXO-CTERM domain-containing protein
VIRSALIPLLSLISTSCLPTAGTDTGSDADVSLASFDTATPHTPAMPPPPPGLGSELKLTASDAHGSAYFGAAVADAGDVDGDGYDDIIVGASTGAAYIYYGSTSGIDPTREDKLVAWDADGGDAYGYAVSGAGDIDGDGYGDVVIGAYTDEEVGSYAGSAYVYYGSASGIDMTREDKLTASDGGSNDGFGVAVSGAGDLDGDGYSDLVIGAPGDDDGGYDAGSAYVYYGSASGIDSASEHKLTGSDRPSYASYGAAVADGGDLDGDGYGDIVIGAYWDSDAASHAGSVYVYHGSASGIDASSERKLTASDADSSDKFGVAVSGAGDVDDDGYDDIVIGASQDEDAASYAGSAYVYYGSTSGIDSASEHKLTASDADASDAFGFVTAGVGDLDNDGFDDIMIGAPYDEDAALYGGSAYVYYGSTSGIDSSSEDKLTASDAESSDYFGWAVSGAGDTNDDGYTDLVIGAYKEDSAASDAGAAYVTLGTCSSPPSWYDDSDGDGYGDASTQTEACEAPEGWIADGSDCDDDDATIHPGATEHTGDGVDSDCDGGELCYADSDGDGFTDGSTTMWSSDADCDDDGEAPEGASTGDCDDDDDAIHPGAAEITGDDVDSDCDGGEYCFVDADNDGYTDGSTTMWSSDADCSDPGEGSASDPTGECDDGDSAIHPGATEAVGDEVDSDCDGTEICYADTDDDGYSDGTEQISVDTDCSDIGEVDAGAPRTDCDDSDPAYHPGADESDCTDPNDYNCDGSVAYADDDGDGWVACEDCDDGDASINPDATELCDGLDNDCDADIDEDADDAETWYADADADGFTDPDDTSVACDPPSGYAAASAEDDCDDGDDGVHPGADEIADDGIDQDCDGADLESTPEDTGDAPDDTGSDKDPEGCSGCASTRSGGQRSAGFGLMLFAGLAVARRRQRHEG